MVRYDTIVIGGGHNGLITAAYLAKAGKKVCVLERRGTLGGCATTEELYPGFRFSPAAYVVSLLLPEVIADLRLKEYGYQVLRRDPSSITFDGQGRHLVLGHDAKRNFESIAGFSKKDAEAFPAYETMLTEIAERLEPLLKTVPPQLPSRLRKAGLWDKARNLIGGLKTGSLMQTLLYEDPGAMEVLTGAADRILNRWFESDLLKGTLATDAIIGAFHGPSSPGSAYVLLHHVMGDAGGARGVWGYIKGGMGGLAAALRQACLDLKVDIKMEVEVQEILVEHNAVRGVSTSDGEVVGRSVASGVDANRTLLQLLDPRHLPDEFVRQVKNIDYSSASGKINLALDGLPDFGVDPQLLRGTIHTTPNMQFIERGYQEALAGNYSSKPVLEMTIPSNVDDSLAPPGKHVLSLFVQYAPYQLSEGRHWDDEKAGWVENCIDMLEAFAPDIRDKILFTHAMTPLDLERTYGLTGGNIMQGAMHLHQLGPSRPLIGWSDHRTPVEKLYLCGAASHPGGGVMGACGRNAAGIILSDL
ncbi:Dehydrosqualene desaturase [Stieleria neptunia]|uniref:Pyridine nucleotide-disulfide oxidoreductase domain-containing protein 2 n=1 Tax=Stieleria neptunia TaxID=2527979 RepID=A0A518HID4_9BACT|nr:NAD(P)/FAD-dependent oxidoreductase [Stieleria neptunia]QDV40563.1 Dehydrosqualene desaturase [Stieleria neptunia]